MCGLYGNTPHHKANAQRRWPVPCQGCQVVPGCKLGQAVSTTLCWRSRSVRRRRPAPGWTMTAEPDTPEHHTPGHSRTYAQRLRAGWLGLLKGLREGEPTAPHDTMLSTLDDGVVVFDAQGRIQACNAAAERLLGSDLDQIQALVGTQANHLTLMNALADGVFIAQDEHFVYANRALPALLGYGQEEFAGLPFDRVVAPEALAE
eukprot:gene49338-66114_t